jgi:hypothetical protein
MRVGGTKTAAIVEQAVRAVDTRGKLAVPDGHEWCPDCDEVKPFTAFGRNAASKTGGTSYCTPCHNARGRLSKETRRRSSFVPTICDAGMA